MTSLSAPASPATRRLRPLPNFIFLTRWLQLPLYLGLILAQCVYVYHFWVELVHLLSAAMGSSEALTALVRSIGYELAPNATAAIGITQHLLERKGEGGYFTPSQLMGADYVLSLPGVRRIE